MIMLDSKLQRNHFKPKILFLRSFSQVTFAAFIAGGLHYAQFDFMQYPPLPENRLGKLDKLYASTEARNHLQRNVITARKELKKKIEQGFFDLILLLDYDSSLFRYTQMSWLKKLRDLAGQSKFFFRKKWSEIFKELVCMQGVPFMPSALSSNRTALAVIDLDDWICLHSSGQKLLQACSSYYKRELPYNRFFLYYQQRPAPWRLWREKLAPICTKVHNIPLGIEDEKYSALKKLRKNEQDIDIFYCGQSTSTIRITALKNLKEFAATTSWNIVIKDDLSFSEYCAAVARSKITLSISGGGWDCFRHYEAVALGSVPLMDAPTVDAFWWNQAPTELFFTGTFKDFQLKIDKLLSNACLRSKCFIQLENLIESRMLHSKIVKYIVHSSFNKKYVAC
ncbi:hypothetical protein GCAAIG_00765 [Candidatus Electronema halotolerans]